MKPMIDIAQKAIELMPPATRFTPDDAGIIAGHKEIRSR